MIKALIFSVAVIAATAGHAAPNPVCLPETQMMSILVGDYGELPVDLHEADNGMQWQVWSSSRGETWTLTVTLGGTTCITDAGEDYEGQTAAQLMKGRGV